MSGDWSKNEVKLIVEDYFAMLDAEINDRPYKKSAHREELSPKLDNRSRGSIEFKHQNISAVLVELGLPYIEGYKPLFNYQTLLADEIREYIESMPNFFNLPTTQSHTSGTSKAQLLADRESVIESSPSILVSTENKSWPPLSARRLDFAQLEANNRTLAKEGEHYVVKLERHWLTLAGRHDLAKKVEWVSETRGDGLGFDILSFDELTSEEKYIEVKTTSLGKYVPFYLTANELLCSERLGAFYYLYRLFKFNKEPRIYILRGSLSTLCKLEPIQYRAWGGALS